MKSPFPGMDPWLEHTWPDVHARLLIYLSDALRGQLPPGLVARAEESLVLDENGQERRYRPDVSVWQQWPEPSTSEGGGVAVAEPVVVLEAEAETYRHIELIDASNGAQVVTVIELLSPTNKIISDFALNPYFQKRRNYELAGVNVVEINLLRGGADICMVRMRQLPPSRREVYRVGVFRSGMHDRREVYPLPLRQRLPRIPIPLRKDDRDAVVDLQALIDQVYYGGGYDTLDYSIPLEPPLSADDAKWAAECLRAAGRLPAA